MSPEKHLEDIPSYDILIKNYETYAEKNRSNINKKHAFRK